MSVALQGDVEKVPESGSCLLQVRGVVGGEGEPAFGPCDAFHHTILRISSSSILISETKGQQQQNNNNNNELYSIFPL